MDRSLEFVESRVSTVPAQTWTGYLDLYSSSRTLNNPGVSTQYWRTTSEWDAEEVS